MTQAMKFDRTMKSNRAHAMRLPALMASLLLLTPKPARGCDFCHEDRATTVYSYRSAERVRDSGEIFVKVRIEGLQFGEGATRIVKALKATRGVVAETVKVSPEQAAASFVFSREVSFETIAGEVSRRAGGVRLSILEATHR